MSHVHGLKKTEAKADKADKAEVQGTARGPSAQGPFARHIGHLRTNGSTVWQGRWAPSSPFETAVLTKISKQNCGDFGFYVFLGLLWKWQTIERLAGITTIC